VPLRPLNHVPFQSDLKDLPEDQGNPLILCFLCALLFNPLSILRLIRIKQGARSIGIRIDSPCEIRKVLSP
jgi:hypothetical protein